MEIIKPTIDVNWEQLKKINILDSDFYLADLFVNDQDTSTIDDDVSLRDNLFVVFQNSGYKIARENLGQIFDASIKIKNKENYTSFWKIYKRPPLNQFHDYFIERRDLLVPQDIRERKGAFFTPRKWVELSQKYLTDYLGENWQEEYFVWDCAAGTGNLLAGLSNKYNLYASTLDMPDVNVMQERVEQGANLLKKHIFQFDFLNDDFIPISKGGKIPDSLYEIIKNDKKRKKLVLYINPPYAEAANARTVTGTGENKPNTSNDNIVNKKYKSSIGNASNELFCLFLIRIYKEIPNCIISNFSTLKSLQSSNFKNFRETFQPKLEKLFLMPADSFDNVRGKFPIGFYIWNSEIKDNFSEIYADVFNHKVNFNGLKKIKNYDNIKYINQWYSLFYDKKNKEIGIMNTRGNDFQNQNYIRISSKNNFNHTNAITKNNLIESSIYLAVRHCINATWLNDRDQFLYPIEDWKMDNEFKNNCLTFSLFDKSNYISCKEGINHWIPFTENEVNSQDRFESKFMTDFINGKIAPDEISDIFKGISKNSFFYLSNNFLVFFKINIQFLFYAIFLNYF